MGDVYDIKSKAKIKQVDLIPPYPVKPAECEHYRKEASSELDDLVAELYEGMEIGPEHAQDIFLLREAVLSLSLKSSGIGHPLQQFALEFYKAAHEENHDSP